MNASNLLSSGQVSIFESVFSDLQSLVSGDNFQRLVDTWVNFVLNSRVLTLKVISDDHKINSVMSGLNIWIVVDVHNLHVKVEEVVERSVLNVVGSWSTHVSAQDILVLFEESSVLFIIHGEVFDHFEFNRGFGSFENLLCGS